MNHGERLCNIVLVLLTLSWNLTFDWTFSVFVKSSVNQLEFYLLPGNVRLFSSQCLRWYHWCNSCIAVKCFWGLLIRFSSWPAKLRGYLTLCAVGLFQTSLQIGFTIQPLLLCLDAFNIVKSLLMFLCDCVSKWFNTFHTYCLCKASHLVNLIWLKCAL